MVTPETMVKDLTDSARNGGGEIGLWWIAQCVHERMGVLDSDENKRISMQIVQSLMVNNIMPGDLGNKPGGFKFWQGTSEELFARIEASWPKGRLPTLGDDGCWFAYKPPQ